MPENPAFGPRMELWDQRLKELPDSILAYIVYIVNGLVELQKRIHKTLI